MKKTPLLTLALGLFILTLALAMAQGKGQIFPSQGASAVFFQPVAELSAGAFASSFMSLLSLLGQNLFLSVSVLAVGVELILLYPSAAIQVKQKKIHLFHKKLVDRFRSGELSLSQSKEELRTLYAVNESLHRRGALLFMGQLLVFVWVLFGLLSLMKIRPENWGALSQFNLMLLAKPAHFLLPLCVGTAYFLHALIKIQFKRKEDYLSPWQLRLSLFIGLLTASFAFVLSQVSSVLVSLYMIQLITFSTLRYSFVEAKAKTWGKVAHRQLIALLLQAKTQETPFHRWRVKLNHSSFFRHFNFHLLEEAASMSLMVGLMVIYS